MLFVGDVTAAELYVRADLGVVGLSRSISKTTSGVRKVASSP